MRDVRNNLAGNGAGMMAAGVTTGATLLAPIRAYSESENAANQLAGSMMGPGGKVAPEFMKLNKLAIALGDRLPGTTADFQNMMTMLRRQGMSAQVILGGLGESAAYQMCIRDRDIDGSHRNQANYRQNGISHHQPT